MYEWALSIGWKEGDVFCLKEGATQFNPDTVYLIPNEDYRSIVASNGGVQITYKGETHSVRKWAHILDVNPDQLRKRILKNPSVEEVFGSVFRKAKFVRDPSLIEPLIRLYKEGKSMADLGRMLDMCRSGIRYHLIKHDVDLREEFPVRKPHVKNEDIVKMLAEGKTVSAISRELGISWPSIANRLKKLNGVKRDRSKG
jgi:hypothetical protein